MHFPQHITNLPAQLLFQQNLAAAVWLAVVEVSDGNFTAEHLLQAHSLAAELQPIRIGFLGAAAFVFHRNGKPLAFPAENRHAVR